jgi:uncharacterized protein (TIGR03437 family)
MSRLASILLITSLAPAAYAQPSISAVLNGASFSASVAPGSWVTIFGKNLAAGTATAQTVPLPTTLGNVSVNVGGVAAQLLYASPNQLNVLIPASVAIPSNTVVPVVVSAPSGASVTYNIRLTRMAPAIFTRNGAGTGRALVFDSKFAAVDTIGPQDTVILYATGLGPTDTSGAVTGAVDVYIGERKAQVQFAGLAPGFPGIYQLNVIAPAPATDRLYLSAGGRLSNITDIGIKLGTNTTNVTGSIKALYPSTDPFFTLPICTSDDPNAPPCSNGQGFSIMLNSATYSVSADVLPSAAPFDVAAVGPGVSALITVDPAAGTFNGTITTITRAAAVGDFSASGDTLWDYLSCTSDGVCIPFPANIVPVVRLDPLWLKATQVLSSPNGSTVTPPNGVLQVSGKLSGSHFAVDAQTNAALAAFGGFVQVPYGPFDKAVSTFRLYVDGKLVTSQDVPYTVVHR